MACKKTRLDRFYEKVDRSGDCWIWTAAKDNRGYANFWDGNNYISGHRWAYQQFVGPIPEGLQIDHLCNTPSCVNPEHMRAVTPWENLKRSNASSAVNARKTHCQCGLPLSGPTIFMQGTRRRCRPCHNARSLARYHRNKAKKAGRAG